jgi:hypothetical protein
LLEAIKKKLYFFANQLEKDSLKYVENVKKIRENGGLIEDVVGDFYAVSLIPTQQKIREIVSKIKTRDTKLIENEGEAHALALLYRPDAKFGAMHAVY